MAKCEHFERELNLIVNEELRDLTADYLTFAVPDYFWHIGASSSGKYHPAFSQGEGGLVRHTKAVVMFCEELMRMSTYSYMPDEYKDYAIVACIIHDTAKYGMEAEMDKEQYAEHAENASTAFKRWFERNEWRYPNTPEVPALLLMAVEAHMGQWSTHKEHRPFTNLDRLVHMADYMTSRSFIDIPQITADWNKVMEEEEELIEACRSTDSCEEDDIPF